MSTAESETLLADNANKRKPLAVDAVPTGTPVRWTDYLTVRFCYLSVSYSARHAMAAYALLCTRIHPYTLALAVALWVFSGLGVTAGAHRYWTHRTYEATPAMEALLLFMFALADQGSVAGWALTHAVHHRYSDTAHDPHNRHMGFGYSHLLWVFDNRKFTLPQEDINRILIRITPLVHQHDMHAAWLDPVLSLSVPTLIAHALWGDALGGLLVGGALRWCVVMHATFTVNSLAHGVRADGSLGPTDNLFVSLVSLGEGWHRYHHECPWDYAAAQRGQWLWNPTKVFIDACALVGLCSRRRGRGTNGELTRK